MRTATEVQRETGQPRFVTPWDRSRGSHARQVLLLLGTLCMSAKKANPSQGGDAKPRGPRGQPGYRTKDGPLVYDQPSVAPTPGGRDLPTPWELLSVLDRLIELTGEDEPLSFVPRQRRASYATGA